MTNNNTNACTRDDESEIGTMQMDQEEYQEVAQELINYHLNLGSQNLLDLAGQVYLTHGPFKLDWSYKSPEDWYFGENPP